MSNRHLLKEGNGIVYHYTSLDTFLKILDGVKYGHFLFHGTDVYSMNDPTEFIHGFRQLWTLLPQIENEVYKNIRNHQLNSNIDECFLDNKFRLSNMWNSFKGKNNKWLKAYVEAMHQSYKSPFVVSFSCHEDYLPMWSTYGDNGNGVAIGIEIQSYYVRKVNDDGTAIIDFTKIDEYEISSLLVSYDKISVFHPLANYTRFCIVNYLKSIPNPKINDEALICLQMKALDDITKWASALIKNEAYKYEEESRIVSYRQEIKDVKFKISSTKKILPYIHIGIPISRFKKIVIGPCCDYNAVKTALKIRLEQQNIHLNDDDIIKSKVPYRVV